MGSIDWKWLIIGILAAWFLLPRLMGMAHKADKA